jgi:hypothetical protein
VQKGGISYFHLYSTKCSTPENECKIQAKSRKYLAVAHTTEMI